MRKVLLVGVAVFLIVAIAATAISWFFQAAEAKERLEKAIANINEGHVRIAYESIQTSGFPTRVTLTLHKPHLTGRIDNLLVSQPGHADTPEWNEDILLDGYIELSANALAQAYTLTVHGNWQNQGSIAKQTFKTTGTMERDMVCEFKMNGMGGWLSTAFHVPGADNQNKLDDFRLLDCNLPGFTLSDQQSGKPLVRSGINRVYITHDIGKASRDARFYAKVTDYEVLPEGDAINTAYARALMPLQPQGPKASSFGKSNMEVDLSYQGPDTLDGNIKSIPINLQLSKFDFSNDIYSGTANLHITNAASGSGQSAKLTFRTETSFDTKSEPLMQESLRAYAKQLFAPGSNLPEKSPLRQYDEESVYNLLVATMPKFHTLGKIVMGTDLSYLGNSEFSEGDFTLSSLEFSTAPYGLTANGTAKKVKDSLFPVANVSVLCRNCNIMVDDAYGFIARLQRLGSLFDASSPAKPIDARDADKLKSFLQAVAGSTGADLTYTITSDGTSLPAINGKTLTEINQLYSQYMGTPLMGGAQ